MDERLLGLWSDEILHPSRVESVDLAFHDDGTGWLYWSSWSTEFSVARYTWTTTAEKNLGLRFHRTLGGTWSVDDDITHHHVEADEQEESAVDVGYDIAPGEDPFGNPITLLILARPLHGHLAGSRFGRVENPRSLDDPTADAPRRA
ncbi:hypothetical protein [Amycolatopsis pittospori]|uniref:hypothetical protein n=1 Tax=Amycolatopsis pittospori TaxID=2749434 RepID=UPI001F34A4F0|nr:hypothetical protein [Amycolatopsis pittospori]